MRRFAGTERSLLLILLVIQGAFTLHTAKGHFTDSYLYYLETESVIERGDLSLDVGYEEHPSPALKLEGSVEHEGRLYSKYPALYSLVAAPFLAVFGESGLFFLNSLALVAVIFLTLRLARRVCSEDRPVWLSIAVLLGGTFFWYYSQAIWPHMVQACLLLGATYAMALARERDETWSWRAGAAGALIGLAVGVRLDSIFVLPALGALCFLGSRPFGKLVSLTGGMLPFLGLLTWLNYVKFGQAIPFTYGLPFGADEKIVATAGYVEAVVPVLFFCGAYLVATGGFGRELELRHRNWISGSLVALAAVSLVVIGEPLFRGLGILLVDMRVLEPDVLESGMTRLASGAVMYAGHFKKALLQSAPFLPLALLPLVSRRRMRAVRDRALLYWLYLVPASFAIIFCALRWHGGMAFDMRYLLPTLPFLSIVAAVVADELAGDLELRGLVRTRPFLLVAVLLGVLLVVALRQRALATGVRELLFLTAPLVVSGVTLAATARTWWRDASLSETGAALLCIPLLWGGPVMLADYDRQDGWRAHQEEAARRIAPHLRPGSLVLGYHQDLFSETRDVAFASLRPETRSHLPALVRRFRTRDRPVFLLDKSGELSVEDLELDGDRFRRTPLEPYWVEAGMAAGGLYRLERIGADRR